MGKKSYLKGAAILGVGAIIAKFLGIFFKIPLDHYIGDIGLGLYGYPYPIYNFFLSISVIGLPLAISKLVSERVALGRYREAHKVFKVALFLLIIIGAFSSLVLFYFRNVIIDVLNWHPDTYYALIGISFAPLFVSIMSAFRGYFQGLQVMTPTAISQLIESFARVIVGLGLAIYLVKAFGIPQAAGGASFGATAGAMAGSGFLILLYMSKKKSILKRIENSQQRVKSETTGKIIHRLLQIAIPACIAATVTSLMNIIDTAMVPARLDVAGFSIDEAAALFGQMTQKAQTLVNVPLTLSMALAASLVPAISEAITLKDRGELKKRTELGIRAVLLISLPAAVGLSFLAHPIINLLFGIGDKGGDILTILGFSVVFVMLTTTLQSILQGLGKLILPIKNLLIGAIIKVIINYTLVAIPSINIKGAAIGSIVGYGIAAILNYKSVQKYTRVKINIVQTMVKPIIAVIAMGISILVIYKYSYPVLGNSISTLLAILIGAFIYFIMLLFIGGITAQEMVLIPGGKRLVPILTKLGILRRKKR